jgi:phosphate transport system substrate-binding protein
VHSQGYPKWAQLRLLPVLCILLLGLLLVACQPAGVDGTPVAAGSAVQIQNKGSDTLVNLALAWSEAYSFVHPEVQVAVTGGGSGTGIASLINRTVDLANASRAMTAVEIAQARANGIEPVEFVIANDAIAVVVHIDNPVERLTIAQLSDIFTGNITNWLELGGEDRPIVALSRETNSGTHIFFLEEVIRQGDRNSDLIFSRDTLLMPSSEGISSEIRRNRNAIGYDGLGYVTHDQKVVAVSVDGSEYILPSAETVLGGQYPVARPLFMYTAGEPTGAVRDYLDWLRQDEAQEIAAELGFVPLAEGQR